MERYEFWIALIIVFITAYPVYAATTDKSEIVALVKGNTGFAIDIYSKLKDKDGNLLTIS